MHSSGTTASSEWQLLILLATMSVEDILTQTGLGHLAPAFKGTSLERFKGLLIQVRKKHADLVAFRDTTWRILFRTPLVFY